MISATNKINAMIERLEASVNNDKLRSNHVVLHTAVIDVKVIRLDKRQMTLSVFRQLDEDSIFKPDGTYRGQPWGRVNYLWGDQEKKHVAFHVVWQLGNVLKRCPVPHVDTVGGTSVCKWLCDWQEGEWPAMEVEDVVALFTESCRNILKLDQLFIAV